MGFLKGFALEAQQGFAQLPEAEAPLEDPGFFGAIGAGFDRARSGADWGWNQTRYENDAKDRILGELRQRGYVIPQYDLVAARLTRARIARGDQPNGLAMMSVDADEALWRSFAEERRRDPSFLKDFGGIRDLGSLSQWAISRRKREAAAADRRLAGASGGDALAGTLIGGLGAGLLDPTSYIPVSGGATLASSAARQVLTVAGKEALANAGVAVVTEPLVRVDAERLGQERTIGDTALDVGLAALTGAVIGGTAKSAELAVPEIRERLIARYFDHLPASMKQRMIDASTIDQRLEAAAIPDMIGRDRLTADERSAASVLEADAQVREANPFRSTMAGDLLHGQRLSASIDALLNGLAQPEFAPPRRPPFSSSTALARGDREIAGRIMQAESGGNPNARNPGKGQSASGLGQFIDSTWLSGIKKWFPATARGKTDEQLLALKTDPTLGRQMTERAVAEYRKRLERADMPVTAGNAYLMHFVGPERALQLMRAPEAMEVKRFLPEAVIAANEKILRGKSVGEVRAWAHERMGEAGGDGPTIVAGGDEDVVALRPEQFDDRSDMRAAETALYGSERGPFGPVHRDIAGDWKATVERLSREETGEVPGAIEHPDVGPIDVVWGSSSMGLRHIIEKHGHELEGRLVERLPELIRDMKISRRSDLRVNLASEEARAGVRLDWDGAEKRWLVTAFENDPARADVTRASAGGQAVSPVRGSKENIGARSRRGKPRDDGPVDLLTQIARWGGLRDDEGNDLARTGGLAGRMTRGGRVLRKEGLSVDQLGERLWEAGWFVDRPTPAEVLDLVDEAVSTGKLYRPEDRPLVEERLRELDDGEDEIRALLDAAAQDLGMDPDAALLDDAVARIRRGEEPDDALIEAINERLFDEAQAEASAAVDGISSPAEPLAEADWAQIEELRRNLDAFDDPDGEGAIAQAMSIEHDLRMTLRGDVAATVPQSAAGEYGLGPGAWLSAVPQQGKPGVSLVDEDGHFINAVFRDEAGVAQGIVRMATSPEGRELLSEVASYVRPDFRRRGIATQLYDALQEAGYDVDAISGTGDLTPNGAAFVNARRRPGQAGERFVLDDSGEARSLTEILDDADREEAAAVAMRACMTPRGDNQ